MARILSISGQDEHALGEGWRMAATPPGACPTPAEASQLTGWIAASAPGTAAGALRQAGRFSSAEAEALAAQDVWWRYDLAELGRRILKFGGLATLVEVWLNDRLILTSTSMFAPRAAELNLGSGDILWLCCRSLSSLLDRKLPRARWRTQLVPRQAMRGVRTTLLGRMPGWTPTVEAAGPWRPVVCAKPGPVRVRDARVRSSFDGGKGLLAAQVWLDGAQGPVTLQCADRSAPLAMNPDGAFAGTLVLPDISAWWPHTHGEQPLYRVWIQAGDAVIDLGRTGFRSIALDRGEDGKGFGLAINGQPVFCRGANWTCADIIDLPCSRDRYEPWLRLARDAGMNMLRMSGTGVYEAPAFFELCDELGILVWQDFMFANFDYPIEHPAFEAEVVEEADGFLSGVQLSPSLAVLCGGSEVLQQATMMGLEPEAARSALFDRVLPEAAARWRPDVIFVDNSPTGGSLPFTPGEGVAHYYGVGAYSRPLEDARRADVRFAAECLAFANLPNPSGSRPGEVSEAELIGKVGVPRDLGADWDFADIRDHYLALLHGVDPGRLRAENPALYLDLSRSVSGAVMEATFAEWRRARSRCRGALVWTLQDVAPGAGWGVVDSTGRPKPCWYALKRAFQPLYLGLTDEGGAGLAIHVVNDGPADLALELELTCVREDGRPAVTVRRPLHAPSRSAQEQSAYAVMGAFYDLNRAYRFGPPSHVAVVARLRAEGADAVLSEAVHLLAWNALQEPDVEVKALLTRRDDGAWIVTLDTDRLARSVIIDSPGFRPSDNWFHLAPGAAKVVELQPHDRTAQDPAPNGRLRVCGSRHAIPFG